MRTDMTTTAYIVRTLLLLLFFVSLQHSSSVQGFVLRPAITTTTRSNNIRCHSRLYVSTVPSSSSSETNTHHRHQQQQQQQQDSKDDKRHHHHRFLIAGASPATEFGSPIDQDTKDRNRWMIHGIKSFLFDNLFAGDTVQQAFARFYALETIARMPYFSYLSVLHLFETLGLWRRADYLKIHFAETWNELHHLLIMEELGGNKQYKSRFIAQHVAFFYYWFVVALYLFNPVIAYNLNQAVEEEAYETYNNFLQTHEDYLKSRPAPKAAIDYYGNEDLYLFDEMHTILVKKSENDVNDKTKLSSAATAVPPVQRRRPVCNTLFDCFVAIRDDEWEHVKTMEYLQDENYE